MVTDACGVSTECQQTFYLEDKKAPSVFCVSVSSVLIKYNEVMIYAQDFIIGAYDNCTDSDAIVFSFSENSFEPTRLVTCDDFFNSPVEIKVYVSDESGNTDFCPVFVGVHLGENAECDPYINVNGRVLTEDDEPIQDAKVILHCNHVEFPQSKLTDLEGYYSFKTLNAYIPGCYLTVEKPGDYLEDVSTLDPVKIMRHILGLQPFTTPYQYIAADVTNDTYVKASDLTMHRKLVLGIISEFPTNTSWKFVDKSFEFSNPNDPLPDLYGFDAEP